MMAARDNGLIKKPNAMHLPLEEVTAECRVLLDDVENDLRWAHAVGYGKAGRGLDAGRGAVNPPQSDDPDHVPGARYDVGTGDHNLRSAYQRTVLSLARIERHLDDAIFLVAGHRLHVAAPTAWQPVGELIARRGVIPGCRRRLMVIQVRLPSTGITVRRRARPAITKTWQELNRDDIALAEQFRRGHRAEVSPFPSCGNCGIRPAAVRWSEKQERWMPTHAGRCHTCAHWYRTHDGQERPRHLDSIDDALEAKARRLDRNEGWGEA